MHLQRLYTSFYWIKRRGKSLVDCVCVYLCLTVEPAARGATVLLGDRLDAPTLVALAAGPG